MEIIEYKTIMINYRMKLIRVKIIKDIEIPYRKWNEVDEAEISIHYRK